MSNLSVNYMGLPLRSPVIVASSGLTTQMDRVKEFEEAGAGAIVVKSLFEEQIVNEAEFLSTQSHEYPESSDYLHYYIRQYSVDRYLTLIKDIKAIVSAPVIASINCYSKGSWTSFAREIERAGADGLELNIYSLPLDIHKRADETEREYIDIVTEIVKNITIPVSVKIGSTFTNLPGFIEMLKGHGAKGVVLFNRFYTPDVDIARMNVTSADAFSHEQDYLAGMRWIGIVSALVPGIDLSASTGIHNGTIALKQLLSGASTVQMCTALYKKGAVAIKNALDDITLFMDKNGYGSIADFKGSLNYSNFGNPGKFERVQFMKSFGGK
ncbi:MAG: dihydroorotate dehydrogenase-like protein [Bacteroidales bacterium]|nr:dihydroorotate dehydrogenase-like protein [Bacteroidales bacterium]MDD2425244.1 dihydroorotate dehydrogenase-like protein [Bacteroidales bacterium]MDD3988933.1 dihydroorotate dehydrogenase-like protein [Bacteroidales bacterium]